MKQLILLDRTGLAEVLVGQFRSARAGLAVDWSTGYLLSRDHEMLLVLGKSVQPPQNVACVKSLVAAVRAEIEATRSEWPELVDGTDATPPEVAMAGRYAIALGDEALIRRDVVVNIATSALGVLLLLLIASRRLGLLLPALVPLALGLVPTFGFDAIVYGRLSAATSLIPTRERQQANLDWLQAVRPGSFNIDCVRRVFSKQAATEVYVSNPPRGGSSCSSRPWGETDRWESKISRTPLEPVDSSSVMSR